MRILVVEDNTVLADTIKEEISRNVNLDVEVLNNGEDALYDIERSIYDIIILDIMLPDLSGIEILRIIRNKGIKKLWFVEDWRKYSLNSTNCNRIS